MQEHDKSLYVYNLSLRFSRNRKVIRLGLLHCTEPFCLGRTSTIWPILCQMGGTTLTQPIPMNPSILFLVEELAQYCTINAYAIDGEAGCKRLQFFLFNGSRMQLPGSFSLSIDNFTYHLDALAALQQLGIRVEVAPIMHNILHHRSALRLDDVVTFCTNNFQRRQQPDPRCLSVKKPVRQTCTCTISLWSNVGNRRYRPLLR